MGKIQDVKRLMDSVPLIITHLLEGFPPDFIIGRFNGARCGYCMKCHRVFTRSVDAYAHWEWEEYRLNNRKNNSKEKKTK